MGRLRHGQAQGPAPTLTILFGSGYTGLDEKNHFHPLNNDMGWSPVKMSLQSARFNSTFQSRHSLRLRRTVREDYYPDYYEFENNNWWFVSRRRILRAFLRKYLPQAEHRTILDAGCGTGINLALLSEFGEVLGVDCSEEAIRFCHLRSESNVRSAELERLPFDDRTFDLVTALDVLEHIPGDERAVSEIARVCKPGGCLLVTVPVFPFLWGEHDEINQHVRRYKPRELLTLLESNRFEIVHRSFMNTWLLPLAFIWRVWRRMRSWFTRQENHQARADNMHHHPWINRILTAAYSSERPFVTGPGLPVGLSLIVLARKNLL